ncbi:hypothetical protein pb186bvf_012811 [Paramecium bursaria]
MFSWKKLLSYKPIEFDNQRLEVIQGKLPSQLEGTLYRNTVAHFERKNGRAGHLFDGDGVVLKVTFSRHEAPIASYKFIQTEFFKEEEATNNFIYPCLGRTPTGSRLTKIINSLSLKNTSSTSLLPLKKGPLLTLWEGGVPYQLQKYSLQTNGILDTKTPFSAHPKVCGVTGKVYNFGTNHVGPKSYIYVYEMDQYGNILKTNKEKFQDGHFLLHDFALCGRYLVIPIFPEVINGIFDILLGSKSLGQDFHWIEERGIEIVIFDKEDNLKLVSHGFSKDIYYVWHYSNGYVDEDGNIVLQQATYKNFDSYKNFLMTNMLKNEHIEVFGQSKHERVVIEPKTAQIIKRTTLHDDSVEFLVVDDADVGQKWDITYGCHYERVNDWANGIIRYEGESSLLKQYESGLYVSEPYYVQDKQQVKGKGWLLLTVYNGNLDQSYVDILDSVSLELLCRLRLPFNISLSFHGRFDSI